MNENDNITNESNVSAAINFARSVTQPKILGVTFEGTNEEVLVLTGEKGEAIVITVRDLFADRAAAPQRRRGTIIVHDLASFVASTNRDSDKGSVIFADAISRKVTSILDFHDPNGPRWGQDRIEYGFTLSPQLRAWLDASRSPMDQKTFARLIDDRLGDIATESSGPGTIAHEFAARRGVKFASVAELVQFTRTIAAKSTVESEEMLDENTGDLSIQYKKKGDVKTNDGRPIAVPPAFALQIPVFCGKEAAEYTVAVRLRYDIGTDGIRWRIELHALEKYLLAAMDAALEIVRGPVEGTPVPGCGLPVFMGTAPAA